MHAYSCKAMAGCHPVVGTPPRRAGPAAEHCNRLRAAQGPRPMQTTSRHSRHTWLPPSLPPPPVPVRTRTGVWRKGDPPAAPPSFPSLQPRPLFHSHMHPSPRMLALPAPPSSAQARVHPHHPHECCLLPLSPTLPTKARAHTHTQSRGQPVPLDLTRLSNTNTHADVGIIWRFVYRRRCTVMAHMCAREGASVWWRVGRIE